MKLHKTETDPEIYYYFLKNGDKRYQYRHKYYDALGKRKEKKKSGFDTEKAALKELLQVKADLLSGQVKKVENDRMSVSQWLDIWYETYNGDWEITSRIQRKDAIDNQMKPRLGKYVLAELDRTTYRRVYINDLLKSYKPSTVQLFHRLFSIAINAAVEDEILTRNRFTKISIEQERKLENFLTPEELNLFLHTAKKRLNIINFTLIFLLAYTGLRRGEAFGLKWRNIDFNQKTITVDCTRDRHGERSPKTKNSYRTIPVDDVLVDQLKVYQKWCLETKFASGLKLDKESDHVFISKTSGEKCCDNIFRIYI
ncbi:hypothetical protein J6TS1_19840 [Siminovitchia terrae]|uniref:Tyr recombinase domain-containing protein n=1 Tax=Siminovitchia terrae TaxID=1914933 RepID=A0ABQ4KWV4_SIMTE|nr:hypothetical protein J6TS1_19840 [Siminovitchia terrae]